MGMRGICDGGEGGMEIRDLEANKSRQRELGREGERYGKAKKTHTERRTERREDYERTGTKGGTN